MLNEDKKKAKKDETEIGFTGKPIPKRKLSPKNRHEFEKKRRKAGYTNKGPKYKGDVTPYYNPLTRLNNEFEVEEGAMPDAIDPKAHRKAQREKKIRDRTKTGDEGSEIAKKKVKGPSLMGETNLVDQILDEVKSDGKVHNCKKGHYWCYEDKKCKKIPMGWHVGRGGYLAKDEEDSEETKTTNGNGETTTTTNGDGGSNGGVSESVDILDANGKKFAEIIDLISVEDLIKEEGLRDWFGKSKSKDGKSGWVNVVTGGTCASDEPGEGIPKCVSSEKRASMTKKERRAAAAAKRREDPNQQKKSGAAKPTMVKTDRKVRKEDVEITEAKDKKGKGSGTKDACYHKVKSRYSVWPSAYASGALVKCRKVGAANWGNKSEEYSDWRSELIEKCWPGYEKKGMKTMFGKRYPNCVKKTKTRKEEFEVCPVCGQDPCQCLEGNVTEAMRLNTKTGNVLMVVSYWRGKSYTSKVFFPQLKLPSKMEVNDEMQKIYPGCRVVYFRVSDLKPSETLLTVLNKEEYELTEGKREDNARRAEIAKKHGIDMTKPGERAKLSRLMNADKRAKNRAAKGDTRSDKEVRKDRADDRKAFDRERKSLEYEKKSKPEIKKSMKKFRDEVRSVDDPAKAPPSREKVRVKVGTAVSKPPADAPKTGRNKPTAEKRADRKSYEAQQRRNAKEDQQNEDWQKVNKKDKTDGMSKKAVAAYRRENPGSKLKTAVTGKVKKGSKDAKRRKSFCARSKGQQDMHNIDCSKTPDKPVCKARRRWKC